MTWAAYFTQCLDFDEYRGVKFSKQCVNMINLALGDTLTALEDIIVEGDIDTASYMIEKEQRMGPAEGEEYKPYYERSKGVLHFSVLGGNIKMVELLLSKGCDSLINLNDFITGFTPLHHALFIESKAIFLLLINSGADISVLDNFDANPIHYARMLGAMPLISDYEQMISVYDEETNTLSKWSIPQFEENTKTIWTPGYRCRNQYIFEIMFSGFTVGEKNEEFRSKYLDTITNSSGDENLILAYINEEVGYGCFAARDFEEGDYIVRYGGCFSKESAVKDRNYSMSSGVESIVLNSKTYRNLGGMINHSASPNSEAQCIFHQGCEQACITASTRIRKGQQILIDYSDSFFGSTQVDYIDMSGVDTFPGSIPVSVVDGLE
eukprot:TRINITY_DN9595_c0_g1_i1.p1 TRINITY_DN9595_c0_g1~~TRINITY_DN9595_c0_g1_i1.p1  ORF type:complete len:407 (-),score=95.36 TRINITY_DN9595_c0_g1_i1:21-1160(-)